jgi:hypothetical protein
VPALDRSPSWPLARRNSRARELGFVDDVAGIHVRVTTLNQRTAERVARNEDTFRRANERITTAASKLDEDFGKVPLICECAAPNCTEIARVTLAEYEQVRANGRTFLVVPGHELTVVDGLTIARLRQKFEAFSLMEKVGEAGEIAERLDPRGEG